MLTPSDPCFIEVSENGEPLELVRARQERDQQNDLYVTHRRMLEQLAQLLGIEQPSDSNTPFPTDTVAQIRRAIKKSA